MTTEVANPVTCDDCGSTKWQGGPKGGLGQMFRCEGGHEYTFYFGLYQYWDKVWLKERAESTLAVPTNLEYKGDPTTVEAGGPTA